MKSEGTKEFVRLVAFSPVQLNFKLVLSQSDVDKYSIDLNKINTIKDIETPLTNNDILEKIVLSSNTFSINALLFINKSSKQKIFVECIPFKKLEYAEDEVIFKKVLKFVADKNYLYFVEKTTTLNYDNEFNFIIEFKDNKKTIKVKFKNEEEKIEKEEKENVKGNKEANNEANNEESKSKSKIIDNDKNNITKVKETEISSPGLKNSEVNFLHKILNTLEYPFSKRDYFFIDLDFIIGLTVNEILQVLSLIDYLIATTNLKIIVSFPNIIKNLSTLNFEILPAINEILNLTDIYIFEKKEISAFFEIINELSDENKHLDENSKKPEVQFIKIVRKKKKDMKLGLFLNEFKTLSLIDQHPQTNLIVCHTDYEYELINNKSRNQAKIAMNDKKMLIEAHYSIFKGAYFGAFLNKFFNKKTFNNSHNSGKKLVSKLLEVLYKDNELPLDPEFYIINIKATKEEQQLGKNLLINKKEVSFVLDCVNKNNSKMNEYNPLQDSNLKIYFNSYQNRKNLKKMGFINQKGDINPDPDFRFLGGPLKNQNLKGQLEYNQNKLIKLKDKSSKLQVQISELCLMKLPELNSVRQDDINKLSLDFTEKPRSLKLPSLEAKWDGHPLLMKNINGRALSVESIKNKHKPNNENSYEHLSKILKNENFMIKQKISEILSPAQYKSIKRDNTMKKKPENKTKTQDKSYVDIKQNHLPIQEEKQKDEKPKEDLKVEEKNEKKVIDGTKIQRQKKNNVIINKKVEEKKEEPEDHIFNTEVEEERIEKRDDKEGGDEENVEVIPQQNNSIE